MSFNPNAPKSMLDHLRGRTAAVLGGVALSLTACAETSCEGQVAHTVQYGETAWGLTEQYSNPDRSLNHQDLMQKTEEINPHLDNLGALRPGETVYLLTDCE